MSSIAIIASGTLFKIESDTSAGTFTTVPEMSKVGCPNCKFDLQDVTSHDSSGFFKEYIPGLSDGENATGDFNFVPTNAIHTQLRVDSYARTKKNWQIIFPGAGTGGQIAFAGYIVGLPPQADVGMVLKNSLTVKVTGLPVWT